MVDQGERARDRPRVRHSYVDASGVQKGSHLVCREGSRPGLRLPSGGHVAAAFGEEAQDLTKIGGHGASNLDGDGRARPCTVGPVAPARGHGRVRLHRGEAPTGGHSGGAGSAVRRSESGGAFAPLDSATMRTDETFRPNHSGSFQSSSTTTPGGDCTTWCKRADRTLGRIRPESAVRPTGHGSPPARELHPDWARK